MTDVQTLLKPDKAQRTLFSLAKVVRLENGSVCFSKESIEKLKGILLDVDQTKHQLLTALRKLDCYKLQLEDFQSTLIGEAVATLATHSPKPDVARLASSILDKWQQTIKETLFNPLPYDAEAAAAAPEGEPEAPEDEIAAIKLQKRMEKLERRRQRDLEMLDDTSSSDSDNDKEEVESDPDWAPQKGKSLAGDEGERRRSRRRSSRRQKIKAVTVQAVEQQVPPVAAPAVVEGSPAEDVVDAVEEVDAIAEKDVPATDAVAPVHDDNGVQVAGSTGESNEQPEEDTDNN